MNPAESTVVELTRQLVQCASVTSHSNEGVSDRMYSGLKALGFQVRALEYLDQNGTSKIALEAKRPPEKAGPRPGGIGYFCHNDVVSVDGWNCVHGGPFDGNVSEGRLWGRGACDMKGSAAAAMKAISNIRESEQSGPIYFFVTGDEECGMNGADVIAKRSEFFAEMVQHDLTGIIGEPTQLQVVNAHKGGCHLDVYSEGIAAHSSTSDGKNANWKMIPFLSYLGELNDRCNSDLALQNPAFSPPSLSFNLVIENRPQSANITVGRSTCHIFFRPMPETPWQTVLSEIQSVAENKGLRVETVRTLPPLHTPLEHQALQESLALLSQEIPLAVCYATDGCFLQDLSGLIVLGPGSIEQAHRPDESITLEQLERGVNVFTRLFWHFACGKA